MPLIEQQTMSHPGDRPAFGGLLSDRGRILQADAHPCTSWGSLAAQLGGAQTVD